MDKRVKSSDDEGEEKITTIFNYCVKDPVYIEKKCGASNRYKIEKYGVERAITDYIQWCGDELANEIYNSIKGK